MAMVKAGAMKVYPDEMEVWDMFKNEHLSFTQIDKQLNAPKGYAHDIVLTIWKRDSNRLKF